MRCMARSQSAKNRAHYVLAPHAGAPTIKRRRIGLCAEAGSRVDDVNRINVVVEVRRTHRQCSLRFQCREFCNFLELATNHPGAHRDAEPVRHSRSHRGRGTEPIATAELILVHSKSETALPDVTPCWHPNLSTRVDPRHLIATHRISPRAPKGSSIADASSASTRR